MRSNPASFLILAVCFAIFCDASKAEDKQTIQDKDNTPVMINQSFVLTKTEREQLEKEAIKGSGEAAFKVANFYDIIVLDHKQAMHWLTIAAENGHPVAQYNLGVHLTEDPNPTIQERAKFWLRKAATNLSPEELEEASPELLKEATEEEKTGRSNR